jgi:5-methyltetrahydrofolate--homocysteine methyltransferase
MQMAEYQITYWKDIPTMVAARLDRRNVVKLELPQRFIVAADEAAMRLGLVGTDAYLDEWRRTPWMEREGTAEEVASLVKKELESEYSPERMRTLLDSYGPPSSARPQPMAPVDSQLLNWLENGEVVLGDGAMGTLLFASGLVDGSAPELWNVTNPDKVTAIFKSYAEAGSKIITTNTFGGSSARLKFHNLEDRVHELNKAGALLARAVADEYGALVAGDIGPSGELIEPVGPLTMTEAQALFAEQVRGLADGGVDFYLIETMSHLNEVEAAVLAIQEVAPGATIAATLSFDTNLHTMMGVSPRQAVVTLAGWGVHVIGANCGIGPDETAIVMTQMAQNRPEGVYLMAQSNAGLPRYHEGRIQFDASPERMADYAVQLRNLGINVVGACCGSTPAHIAAMAEALAAVKDQPISGAQGVEIAIESAESRSARAAERRASRRAAVSEGA